MNRNNEDKIIVRSIKYLLSVVFVRRLNIDRLCLNVNHNIT